MFCVLFDMNPNPSSSYEGRRRVGSYAESGRQSPGVRSPRSTSAGTDEGHMLSTTPQQESWVHNVEEDAFNMNVLAEEMIKAGALRKVASRKSIYGTNSGASLASLASSDAGALPTTSSVYGRESPVPTTGFQLARQHSDVSSLGDVMDDLSAAASFKSSGAVEGEDALREQFFANIPDPYPHAKNFKRVAIMDAGDDFEDADNERACVMLHECMTMREKWIGEHPAPPQDAVTDDGSPPMSPKRGQSSSSGHIFRRRPDLDYDPFGEAVPPCEDGLTCRFIDGVMHVFECPSGQPFDPLASRAFGVPDYDEFREDYVSIMQAAFSGPVASYSYTRLELLAARFNLHVLLNDVRENDAQKSVPHRDFYNVRKVDTHVHHSACMNQKHLLRFIKFKLRTQPNEVVIFRDGQHLTLGDVFKSLNLTAYDLSIDTLDMHAHDTFHRFDRFNLKYNPAGQSRLREIFLKTDNYLDGRYLAELSKEVFTDLDASKYQLVEWRISIYGRDPGEFSKLAKWFYHNRVIHKNVRWLIQVPRLFQIYRSQGKVESFAEMMENIFKPLFDVSIDPQSDLPLHYFLQTMVGFDSVDDESRPESGMISQESRLPSPKDWTKAENPPYGYWMYYMYANICTLNKLRAARGLCTFQFRPHCGEAGDICHLVSSYLLAHQINHGILLRKNPGLQYLYYLSQIGIAMSPLSNNKLFLDYAKNPFPKFFSQGMNVSLSTDDPLMLHYTKDALLEEYSVATQVWKLSSTDQCEIARNSVLQSGWELKYKKRFLGQDLQDIRETNVPEIRLQYRKEVLEGDISEILKYCND